MRLELKQLSLSNFKGIREKTIEFGAESFIHGANASGKTTLLDAFLWCLFGKDHLGRADHKIKPFDNDGETIPRIEVSVEVVITIDGAERTLRRTYLEEWVKPRMQEEEVLKGHTTRYFVNDVSVKKSEFETFVSEICDEEVFKSITNPSYFPGLDKNVQRAFLFSFVELTDEQIAGSNEDYKQLLLELTGKTFDAFRKEIASKKSRINLDLKGLPERIAGLKEGMPELPNEAAITAQLTEKQERFDEIESKLNDVAKNMSLQNQKRMDIQFQINNLNMQIRNIENSQSSEIEEQIYQKRSQVRKLEEEQAESKRKKAAIESRKVFLQQEEADKRAKLVLLRQQWTEISSKSLEFPEGAFVCPTCQRLLEVEDIEDKQRKMTENFNIEKAKQLDENQQNGQTILAELAKIDEAMKNSEQAPVKVMMAARITALNNDIKKLEEGKESVKETRERAELKREIQKLEEALKDVPNVADNSELINEKKVIVFDVDGLKSKLALKDVVANTKKLIAEHEKHKKALSQELATLEKSEFILKQFEFEKNLEYEKRINKMFRFVKFRLFHKQVDGQIVPDFECMVDGVPYSTLNNAMQVCAGLDIINTISKLKDVYAPIWLDNRESITHIPEIDSQLINLVVDPDSNELTIK